MSPPLSPLLPLEEYHCYTPHWSLTPSELASHGNCPVSPPIYYHPDDDNDDPPAPLPPPPSSSSQQVPCTVIGMVLEYIPLFGAYNYDQCRWECKEVSSIAINHAWLKVYRTTKLKFTWQYIHNDDRHVHTAIPPHPYHHTVSSFVYYATNKVRFIDINVVLRSVDPSLIRTMTSLTVFPRSLDQQTIHHVAPEELRQLCLSSSGTFDLMSSLKHISIPMDGKLALPASVTEMLHMMERINLHRPLSPIIVNDYVPGPCAIDDCTSTSYGDASSCSVGSGCELAGLCVYHYRELAAGIKECPQCHRYTHNLCAQLQPRHGCATCDDREVCLACVSETWCRHPSFCGAITCAAHRMTCHGCHETRCRSHLTLVKSKYLCLRCYH